MSIKNAFQTVLAQRLTRRNIFKSALCFSGLPLIESCSSNKHKQQARPLNFVEVDHSINDTLSIPEGYEYQTLIRWGDPLFSDGEAFDPLTQTPEKQSVSFGFNNDYVGFLPLPLGNSNSEHGLLVINHEYTSSNIMFPGSPEKPELTRDQTDIDIFAHGMSVIEISKHNGQWQVDRSSNKNRRITPLTEGLLTGPAAGSKRLMTNRSTDGVRTLGTYANCAGGITPWGTVLSGEENINTLFSGDYSQSPEYESLKRFEMDADSTCSWARYYDRWNLSKQPNESFHMGWVVELDPYNPDAPIKKRTALGRLMHEGCNIFINKNKRVIAYTGDDSEFEYIYKFISKGFYQENNRQANMDLLEDGTLYCARFNDDGTVEWLPMVYGQGPLTPENGFHSQADVCIDTRKAGDLLGATPMDRPEDVEVNPETGRVYVMLTKNNSRSKATVNIANPRSNNRAGQIVELIAPDNDHTADVFNWDMFLLAGELNDSTTNYHPETSSHGWLACPDNCAFDIKGNIWITSDGAKSFGIAEGIWASATQGEYRRLTKRFLSTPVGAELCGPVFTPDGKNLFCAVQHPGEGSSFDQPTTRWPDFDETMPPRPAVIVINKKDGGLVGS